MAWRGFAEGKELQQLVCILKYVQRKTPHVQTHSFAESIRRALVQKQAPDKNHTPTHKGARSGREALIQMTSRFPYATLASKGPPSFPQYWIKKHFLMSISLSKAQWACIQLQQAFWALVIVMKLSDSAKPHQRGNMFTFVHRNSIRHGRKKKAQQNRIRERCIPTNFYLRTLALLDFSRHYCPTFCLLRRHRPVLQRLFPICQVMQLNQPYHCSSPTSFLVLMLPLPW